MSRTAAKRSLVIKADFTGDSVADDFVFYQAEALELVFLPYSEFANRVQMPEDGHCKMEAWLASNPALLYIDKVGTVNTDSNRATVTLARAETAFTPGNYLYTVKVFDADETLMGVVSSGEFTVKYAPDATEVNYIGPFANLDYSNVQLFENTATHGPYRAGDNVTFTANGDGSVDINAPAAPAVPVQSVDGRTGDVTLDDLYLGITATAADVDPAGTTIAGALADKVDAGDSRLTDAREWTADTVSQAEAEAGTETTRRAFTAQRVRQAVVAWWATITDVVKTSGDQTVNGVKSFNNQITAFSGLQSSGDIVPIFTNQRNLGTSFFRWLNIFCNGVNASGFSTLPTIIANIFRSSNFFTFQIGGGNTEQLRIDANGLTLTQQTPSLPLSLDANKRAVTLAPADFRTLIGLAIGTDVQAQNATLQALADAADDAARRAAVGGAARVIPTVTESGTTRTLAKADVETFIRLTNAGACTITIPAQDTVTWADGDIIYFRVTTVSPAAFVLGSGVSVNGGAAVTSLPQHSTFALRRTSTVNVWDLI